MGITRSFRLDSLGESRAVENTKPTCSQTGLTLTCEKAYSYTTGNNFTSASPPHPIVEDKRQEERALTTTGEFFLFVVFATSFVLFLLGSTSV